MALTDLARRNPGLRLVEPLIAVVYAETDRHDEARQVLEHLAADAFKRLPRDTTQLRAVTLLAAVVARLGDREHAEALHDHLAPHVDQIDILMGLVSGSVAHHLGILAATLGRFEEAESHFASASASHARIGAPTWLARTQLEWARMLIHRANPGDRERSRELLAQSLAIARQLELGRMERDAAALLSHHTD